MATKSLINDTYIRKEYLTNSDYRVATYGTSTSTSGHRKHLCDNHMEEWVDSCDALGIKISGKAVIKQAEAYRVRRDGRQAHADQSDGSNKRPEFSNEAFVDALTDFIIADDQVYIY